MEKRRFGIKALVFVSFVSLLIGIFITGRFDVTTTTSAGEFWKEATGKEKPMGPPSFAALAKKLMPPVVNISTTQVIKERPLVPFPEFRTPFDDFFGEEFFKKFYNGPPREFKRHSLGSGFIINKEGYILTNYHVIENATEIIVTLSEEKKEYRAEVIGKDKKLDLALIKIDAKEELPVAVLGDSDSLQIGEWVIAIGNPFGLGGTVTAGIVSQKGRVIGAGPYDNFIQTDASINPGNSGGPLFNTRGEVVGINTAIIAGGQGIGFAIPINMVKDVLIQLKERGKVIRGWIGVTIQQITPDIALSMGLKEPRGALVSSVMPKDPADRAGIKPGDIIVEFDGKPINEMNDLPRIVAATPPGKKVKVKVLRDGKPLTLTLEVKEKKEEEAEARVESRDRKTPAGRLGIAVRDITPELMERYNIDEKEGVFVYNVTPDSPAYNAGIRRGDIIKEIDRKPVRNVEELRRALKEAEDKEVILVRIKRRDTFLYKAIRLK